MKRSPKLTALERAAMKWYRINERFIASYRPVYQHDLALAKACARAEGKRNG